MMVRAVKPSQQWISRWEASSLSDPAKLYIVAMKNDGSWGCSCPAWRFHKQPRPDCKHILQVQASEPVDTQRSAPKAAERRLAVVMARKSAAAAPAPATSIAPYFVTQTRRAISLED